MSTQILTELPNIQKAGMDFDSVIKEINNIINDNPNWKENWSEFYDSEAGVMLSQLMAWISDNMSTRQDLLHNEMFIGTAQKDSNKVKHLQQIGYIPQMPHSAKAKIKITLNKVAKKPIIISTDSKGKDLSSRVSQIASFEGKDINGRNSTWEIIRLKNGKPDYLSSIELDEGNTEYRTDSNGNELFALQGKTVYEEFTASTENGSFFNLKEKEIAANSLQVLLKKNGAQLQQVNSFVSKEALDENLETPFVLELNEDLTYRIRFASKGMLKDTKLLPAGSVISVFYRVSNGSLGNIKPGFINKDTNYMDQNGNEYKANIFNDFPAVEGSDKESLDSAVTNGPISLRTMDRAVTPEDYNIILDRNTSIYKAKTYTASNQPKGFRNYYGRYINPQESFSFVMLNKDHGGIPTSKLNDFPWVTTIREPRINERYIFDNAKYNSEVKISQTEYNIIVEEEGNHREFFRNATILDLGQEFNKSLYYLDEEGNSNPNSFLTAKISTEETNESYFAKIPFSLFSDNDSLTAIEMDKFNLMSDDNARFLTRQELDLEAPIDVKAASKFTFVLNGELKVNVDLLAGQFEEGNLPESCFLKWTNQDGDEASEYMHDSTSNAAKYRLGIVELINKSINKAIMSGEGFENVTETSKQYFGFKNITNPKDGIITSISSSDSFSFALKIKGVTYLFKDEKTFNIKDDQGITINTGEWGSIQRLSDFLEYAFRTGLVSGGKVLKLPEGSYTPVEIEGGELAGYHSKCMPKIFFATDEGDDSDPDSGIAKETYDVFIYSSKDSGCLTDISYLDKTYNNYEHHLYNVVDIQDTEENVSTDKGNYFKLFESTCKRIANRSKEHYNLPQPTQAANYENRASIKYYGEGNKKGRIKISSPTKGSSSSIYFVHRNRDEGSDFAEEILKVYFYGDYSNKAYGVKRAYLLRKDALNINTRKEGKLGITDLEGRKGNVVFENSCIYNEPDFKNLFVSYKLKKNNSLLIGSVYDNYYYMDGEKDEISKKPVVGLLGQFMDYTILEDGTKKYKLDPDKSNFNIKFTKEKKNTNSIFAITSDLDIVGSDKVKILSYDLSKGIPKECEILTFKIDDEPEISVSIGGCQNGYDVVSRIKNIIKNGEIDYAKLKENVDSVINTSYESINQINFKSIARYKGSITFIKKENMDKEKTELLYKTLFGTNKQNTRFYELYPPTYHLLKKENIKFIKGTTVEDPESEFFYCPEIEYPLIFDYRELVVDEKTNKVTSRGADYYISVETVSGKGKNDSYRFYLKKTEDSLFPDSYFYMHFVNDKTYDFDAEGKVKETEESMLQDYMQRCKISGTDIVFLQPYFKTYDIAASIMYNNNFSKSEVSQNVKKAIDSICDLKHSDIAGSMSRAKIFKAIMNCDGVEDCKITYFGYDYPTGFENSEELTADFYEIICLHEDDNISNKHGKILTFDEY